MRRVGWALALANIGTMAHLVERDPETVCATSKDQGDEPPAESRQVRRAKERAEAKRLGTRKRPKK